MKVQIVGLSVKRPGAKLDASAECSKGVEMVSEMLLSLKRPNEQGTVVLVIKSFLIQCLEKKCKFCIYLFVLHLLRSIDFYLFTVPLFL